MIHARSVVLIGLQLVVAGGARPPSVRATGATLRAATVTGVVFDSLAGKALVGANVQLVGADSIVASQRFTALSDSAGRFRFASVPGGRYLVGFYHAALDSLGIEARAQVVDIGTMDQTLAVATPSAQTIIRGLCGADSAGVASATLLLGHLHDAESEAAVVKGTIVAAWVQARIDGRSIGMLDGTATAVTGDAGWFAVCGLPSNITVTVRAVRDADSTGALGVRMSKNTVAHVSLYVAHAGRAPNARLVGRVVDAARNPIAAARARIDGSDRESGTAGDGGFVLDSLPAGTQSLEVRAIGYSPREIVVHLTDAMATTLDVVLERAVVLPAVVTRAAIIEQNLAIFEQHKRSSAGGFFLKPVRLEGYPGVQPVRALVQGLPGVAVTNSRGLWVVSMQAPSTYGRGPPTRPCTPPIFVDGKRSTFTFDDVNTLIDADDIVGVEVYTREAQIPSVYSLDVNKPCGLISVWTSRVAPKP